MDPLLENPSKPGWLSFLDWLDRPGQVVRNTLRGNLGGAVRQGADFFLDAVDAGLPGDVIDEVSRPEDSVTAGELIGMEEPGLAKTLVDVVGGVVTDPFSALTFGAGGAVKGAATAAAKATGGGVKVGIPFTKIGRTFGEGRALDPLSLAGQGIEAGLQALPESISKPIRQVGLEARDTLGWLNPAPHIKQALSGAAALSGRTAKAGHEEARRIMGGLAEPEQVMVGDIIDNLKWGDNGVEVMDAAEPLRRAGAIEGLQQQIQTLMHRATSHPMWEQMDEAGRQRLSQAVQDAVRLGHRQFKEAVEGGALARPKQYVDAYGVGHHMDELTERFAQEKGIAEDLADASKRVTTRDMAKNDQALKRVSQKLRDLGVKIELFDELGGPQSIAKRFATQGKKLGEQELQGVENFGKIALESDRVLSRIGETPAFEDWLAQQGLRLQDVDIASASPRNYLQRMFSAIDEVEEEIPTRGKHTSSLESARKERKLKTPEDLAGFLNSDASAGLDYERNAFKRLVGRSDQQGRLLQKASIAREVLGPAFNNLVDGVGSGSAKKSTNAAVTEAINAMAKNDPDSARALANAFVGMTPRGPIMDVLAQANRFFKPAAVYGVIFPKFGSIVRNAVGGSWQLLSTQGAGAAGKQLKQIPSQLLGAIDDGIVKAFGVKRLTASDITRDMDLIDQAFKAGGGDANAVMEILAGNMLKRPDLAEAVQHGVLDAFVSSEQLLKEVAKGGKAKAFMDVWDMPGAMFQGIEQRMRLANFLDQVKAGRSGEEAARGVREAFLDYTVTSGKNRALRDLVPFAAFLTQSIPQQAKFLSKNPAAGIGLANLYGGGGDSPIYPWLSEQASIPMGADEEGNQQYLAGLGLPVEALSTIPNVLGADSLRGLGRDVERNLVAKTQPLVKSLYGAVTGEDPFFNTAYGTYDDVPVFGKSGAAGRAYNTVIGTGLAQPIDTPLRLVDDLLDDRKGPGDKALDLLTGANVVSVDEDRALQQILTNYLERNPDVTSARTLYSNSEDPEIRAMLEELRNVKQRIKKKRDLQPQ